MVIGYVLELGIGNVVLQSVDASKYGSEELSDEGAVFGTVSAHHST